MRELQAVGAIDPAAREELIADLKQTDPSRWPLVIQEFRAAAAYRRRIARNDADRAGQRSTADDSDDRYKDRAEPNDYQRRHAQRDEYLTPVALTDNRLAISPESSLPGVAVTGVSMDRSWMEKTGEATALPIEPPLSARLQASREKSGRFLRPEDGQGEGAVRPVSAMSPAAPGKAPEEGKPSQTSNARPGSSPGARPEQNAPLTPADWHVHLAAAIRSLETASPAGSGSENDIALQARLRMLYLLAGRRDDAMRPLPAAPKATQEYWTSQIYGLSTWMDSERTPDPARRAAETKRILSEAVNQLGDTAPLTVRNLTFCTAVRYYGSFDAAKAEFTPGQKVLLYAEVENFHREPTSKGFHTAVKFNWEIFDARGNRVGDYVSAACEEDSLTPKHEFFITKMFFLPSSMAGGRYTLQFTVEDVLGRKVGQSSLGLTIR